MSTGSDIKGVSTAAPAPTNAGEVAIATIKQEHRVLRTVIEVLLRLLTDIAKQHAEPDFVLLASMLYYIDEFPERYHHPKEDEFLFKALRRRTTALNAELDELQAEHIRGAQMIGYLQRALVHYQGGAPDGLTLLKTAVDAYAAMLSDHMRKEDSLLARAHDYLPEEDWREIAAAFDANDDPLFGEHQREEFRRLYFRIVNLLPQRIRTPMQRPPHEQ